MLALDVVDREGNRVTHTLGPGRHVLGKSPECDLVVSDPHVSRRHLEIVVEAGAATVADLGSTNGTWIGARRIEAPERLSPPSELRAGTLRLIVRPQPAPDGAGDGAAAHAGAGTDGAMDALKRSLHARLVEDLDLRRRAVLERLPEEALRREARAAAERLLPELAPALGEGPARERLVAEVVAEAIGLGPLEPLMEDPSVTEIMVNGPGAIYVERGGRIERTDLRFSGEEALRAIIDRIVAPLGRRIDEAQPMVDARLPDGSRVNAIIPPLSLCGPVLTIRRFARTLLTVDDLIANGTLSPEMARFLEVCVRLRRNIAVSGGTGSGKTTTLNVLSNFIPEEERIITIEDAAELSLHQTHVVSLEARPANAEGKGLVTIRDLVRNALRMRPDRIVVGECRGGEALDMLQAMNTGHDGSLTTGHANSPRDFLSRLEVMVLMAGVDIPHRAVREQIASAIDILIHQTRFSDGRRRITRIVEVDGMEGDVILLQDIFAFERTGTGPRGEVLGRFRACGHVPRFYEEARAAGHALDLSIFRTPEEEGA